MFMRSLRALGNNDLEAASLPSPLGGEGLGVRGKTLSDCMPAPSPQPLSPEGRGEQNARCFF